MLGVQPDPMLFWRSLLNIQGLNSQSGANKEWNRTVYRFLTLLVESDILLLLLFSVSLWKRINGIFLVFQLKMSFTYIVWFKSYKFRLHFLKRPSHETTQNSKAKNSEWFQITVLVIKCLEGSSKMYAQWA